MDYAQAVARVLSARITDSRTTTAKATVTAVTTDGFVTFTDALGSTRKGVWLSQPPVVGKVITYLDEGSGFPLVLGTAGDRALGTVFNNSGTVYTARTRAGSTVQTSTSGGVVSLTFTPALGTVLTVMATIGDNLTAYIFKPIAGQWVAGATTAQFVVVAATTDNSVLSTLLRFNWIVIDVPT